MALSGESRQILALTAASLALCMIAPIVHGAPVLEGRERPLTSLRAIHALSNAQASHQLPVSFEATVTYYRGYERTLFVQDGDIQPGMPQTPSAGRTSGPPADDQDVVAVHFEASIVGACFA